MRVGWPSGGELAGEARRKRAEEVAAHSALYLVEVAGGVFNPGKVEDGVEALELGVDVRVAEKLGGACAEEEKVFEQER